MPTTELTADDFTDGKIDLLAVMVKSGLVPTRSEGKRAVEQGGVAIDGEKVSEILMTFTPEDLKDGKVFRRGKKTFRKVIAK